MTWGFRPVMVVPSKRISPAVGTYRPLSMFRMVVLPEPFGPDQRLDLAAADLHVHAIHRLEAAEVLGQPLDGQQGAVRARTVRHGWREGQPRAAFACGDGGGDLLRCRRAGWFHHARSRWLTGRPWTRPAIPPGMKIMIRHDARGVDHHVGVLEESQHLGKQSQEHGPDDGPDGGAVSTQDGHGQQDVPTGRRKRYRG